MGLGDGPDAGMRAAWPWKPVYFRSKGGKKPGVGCWHQRVSVPLTSWVDIVLSSSCVIICLILANILRLSSQKTPS